MNIADLAWAAGFIDGEGCISVIQKRGSRTGKLYHSANINAPQINKDPLLKLQKLFGGSVQPVKIQGNRRRSYVWSLRTKQAAKALELMLPYLLVKKAEAELLLAFQYSMTGSRLSNLDFAEREAVRESLMEHHQTYEYDKDGG